MHVLPRIPLRVEDLLLEFRRRLSERFGDTLLDLRLFGSYARGEASEESDVDVFVLLRGAAHAERRAVLDIAGNLWRETGFFLSPTVFDEALWREWRTQERPLVMAIERDGIRP